MFRSMVVVAAAFLAATPAVAGPNAGGTLIVHDTGFTCSTDLTAPPGGAPLDCSQVDDSVPAATCSIWKVYAAFPEGSCPRLKAVTWGMEIEGAAYVLAAGLPDPASDFEVVEGGWPTAAGSIGESFGATKTGHMVECYWFVGYGETGATFSTAPHASHPSQFQDDSYPANTDPIAGFSSLGFGHPGQTVCMFQPGVCCLASGECQLLSEAVCQSVAGVFQGAGTSCVPNPCEPPGGACCFANGSCQFLLQFICQSLSGNYQGNLVPCTPSLCPQPTSGVEEPTGDQADPQQRTTWGRVKATYR